MVDVVVLPQMVAPIVVGRQSEINPFSALAFAATIRGLVVFQRKCGLEAGASPHSPLTQAPRSLSVDRDVIASARSRPNSRGRAHNRIIALVAIASPHELGEQTSQAN